MTSIATLAVQRAAIRQDVLQQADIAEAITETLSGVRYFVTVCFQGVFEMLVSVDVFVCPAQEDYFSWHLSASHASMLACVFKQRLAQDPRVPFNFETVFQEYCLVKQNFNQVQQLNKNQAWAAYQQQLHDHICVRSGNRLSPQHTGT